MVDVVILAMEVITDVLVSLLSFFFSAVAEMVMDLALAADAATPVAEVTAAVLSGSSLFSATVADGAEIPAANFCRH